MEAPQVGFKLFRLRKDGSLGSLFINRRARLPIGEWLEAEEYPTKGFALRPGWHATLEPVAPHLKTEGRVWRKVLLSGVTKHQRPEAQGGTWLLANQMLIL